MKRELFERHIDEAIQKVPKVVRDKIHNVAFVLEDDVRKARTREREITARGMLLGLYEGIPLPARSAYYSAVLPDKITLFKNAIERVAGPETEAIRRLIHDVVHHEIGHYLGMDEQHVRRWERKRKRRKD